MRSLRHLLLVIAAILGFGSSDRDGAFCGASALWESPSLDAPLDPTLAASPSDLRSDLHRSGTLGIDRSELPVADRTEAPSGCGAGSRASSLPRVFGGDSLELDSGAGSRKGTPSRRNASLPLFGSLVIQHVRLQV